VPAIAPIAPATMPPTSEPADAPIAAPQKPPLRMRAMNWTGTFRLGVFGS
jgi:hypothetical protein